MRRGLVVLVLVGVLVATAHAARVRSRRMGIQFTATHVTVSFRFRDLLLHRSVRRKVESGLQTTVLATLHAHRSGNVRASVGGAARTCRLSYDIWDEDYRATIVDPNGRENRYRLETYDEVVRCCADVRAMQVAPRDAFRRGRTYRISARLELNPLSARDVRRIQRWLRNPEPTGEGEGAGIFGSVGSLFVNPRFGRAERALRLRSQRFTVP